MTSNRPNGERHFERKPIIMSGVSVSGYTLHCAMPLCRNSVDQLDRTAHGYPSHVVKKHFERKHWEVGKNDKHDICPDCLAKIQQDRRDKRSPKKTPRMAAEEVFAKPASHPDFYPPNMGGKPENWKPAIVTLDPTKENALSTASKQTSPTTLVRASEEPPREMQREDRRIIFVKLEEVYVDEKTGYAADWTDAKVAKSLDCPQAWVEKIREENFGPARSNDAIREFLASVEAHEKLVVAVNGQVGALQKDLGAIIARANVIGTTMADLSRRTDALSKEAAAIRKDVG